MGFLCFDGAHDKQTRGSKALSWLMAADKNIKKTAELRSTNIYFIRSDL